MLYTFCFMLFMIGLYCAVVKKNMVKIVIGVCIMEYAVNLFLIMLGYRREGIAPIVEPGDMAAGFANRSVDPLPQALVLTAIVIGLATLALMIALCLRVYSKYGTFDITEIRRLRG